MKHTFIYRHYYYKSRSLLFVLLLRSKHIAYCLQYNIFANSSCHCILCKLQLSFRFLQTQQHCLKDSVRKKNCTHVLKKAILSTRFKCSLQVISGPPSSYQILQHEKNPCNKMPLSVRNLIRIYFPHLQFVSVLQ